MFRLSQLNILLACACYLVSFAYILRMVSCIVVDGDRKDELSPIKNQIKDEKSAIDSFNTKTCGIADPNSEEHEFINMAREGQFPWLVSFQIKIMSDASYAEQIKASAKGLNDTKKATAAAAADGAGSKPNESSQLKRHMEDMHFCSGSFISDKWILSAAHCFSGQTIENYLKNNKLKAVAGSHKVSSRNRLNRNLTIERIYVHSKFDHSLPIGFDIALIELRQGDHGQARVNFSQKRDKDEFGEQSGPFMNSICLPLKDKEYKANESARIAGWGLSRAKDVHTMPSKLLTTDLLIKDTQDNCLEHYSKALDSSRPMEQHSKHKDLMCASYNRTRDACQSDSGGPLMQYANKKAIVIGIVSYGIGCATKGVPGLYTRTAAYIDWIKEITLHGRKAKQAAFKLLEAPPPQQPPQSEEDGDKDKHDDHDDDDDDDGETKDEDKLKAGDNEESD